MKKASIKRHLPSILALTAAVLILTLPALHHGYLLEDYKYIRAYAPSEILHRFASNWEPTADETKGYRPFHTVHYTIFHLLIGGDPLANHLLKTVLIVLLALLIYLFAWRCSGSRAAAFWTALVYNLLGANAWQASWINHRHHILQGILVVLSLIFYDRYIDRRRSTFWLLSFLCFLSAFLLKEEVAAFPLILAAYLLLVKKAKLSSLVRPLAPFFLLTVFLVLMRWLVVRKLPADYVFPPPVPVAPGDLAREYGRSLLGTLVQTYGVQDPVSPDFPMYGSGLNIPRDYLGLFSLLGLLALGGAVYLPAGSGREKRTAAFGVCLLLLSSLTVAAWYRNNRLYVGSLGVTLIIGPIAAAAGTGLVRPGRSLVRAGGAVLALAFLAAYLTANLGAFIEIRHALRPDGALARVWDGWVYEGYLPLMNREQLERFRERLLRTGENERAAKVSEYFDRSRDAGRRPHSGGSRANAGPD